MAISLALNKNMLTTCQAFEKKLQQMPVYKKESHTCPEKQLGAALKSFTDRVTGCAGKDTACCWLTCACQGGEPIKIKGASSPAGMWVYVLARKTNKIKLPTPY